MQKEKATGGREVDVARALSQLSTQRVLRNAGQVPDCIPEFCVCNGSQLEVRQRLLRLFQQAVRKVILRCCMSKRLTLLQKEVKRRKDKDEKPEVLKLPSDKLLPFMLPVFSPANQPDELAVDQLGHVHVEPFKVDFPVSIQFFNLKVPQYYKLAGYEEVSVYDAGASFVQSELCRPLRTGAQDELWPAVEVCDETELSFSAPRNLLNPPSAHPLRIFNPAPGVHAFKPTPYYLESDPEFHLCPLPKHPVSKGKVAGVYTPSTQKTFLDRKDVIKGIMTWKEFPSVALNTLSCASSKTSNWLPRMSDPFNSSLLPLEALPTLHDLPERIREELSGVAEYTGVSLTPEMVEAEFGPFEISSSKPSKKDKDDRKTREQLSKSMSKSQRTQLGPRVLARLKYINSLSMQRNSSASHD